MRLTVIGRDPKQAEIVISNEYVSNYHAELIQLDNGDMFIIDKSTNGTFLDGSRLAPGKETPVRRGADVTFTALGIPLDWSAVPYLKTPEGVRQTMGIGSHYMNRIVVNGTGVSRFHATVREMSDGTLVSGQSVAPCLTSSLSRCTTIPWCLWSASIISRWIAAPCR